MPFPAIALIAAVSLGPAPLEAPCNRQVGNQAAVVQANRAKGGGYAIDPEPCHVGNGRWVIWEVPGTQPFRIRFPGVSGELYARTGFVSHRSGRNRQRLGLITRDTAHATAFDYEIVIGKQVSQRTLILDPAR